MASRQQQQLLSLVTQIFQDSVEVGRQEEMVFGKDLEDLIFTAGAEAVAASRFLDLLITALSRDDAHSLDNSMKALRGTLLALTRVAENLGRFYGNPNQRLRSASAERVAQRYLEVKDE